MCLGKVDLGGWGFLLIRDRSCRINFFWSLRIPCLLPLDCQFLLSLRVLIFPCFRSRWGRLRESGLVVLSLLFVILSQEVWLMLLLGLLSVLCCCLPVCIQELNPEEVSQTRSVPRVGACREEGVWEICTKHCR